MGDRGGYSCQRNNERARMMMILEPGLSVIKTPRTAFITRVSPLQRKKHCRRKHVQREEKFIFV